MILTGNVRDIPDPRDFVYRPPPGALFGGTEYDLTDLCAGIRDQIAEDCTGHGTSAQAWAVAAAEGRKLPELSALWPWTNGRILASGFPLYDQGTNLRSVYKGLSGQTVRDSRGLLSGLGFVPEADWPELPENVNATPPDDLYREGAGATIGLYARIPEGDPEATLAGLLSALARKRPPTVCFVVDESFGGLGGGVYMGNDGSKVLGGHCMLVVGYSQTANAFLIRNSWGVGWGDNGYGWVNQGFILNHAYDLWTIEVV